MRKILQILLLTGIFLIGTSFSFFHKIDYRAAMQKNVCKSLKNDILLYFIFIDSKATVPWTEFDIKTTIDSIAIARKWLTEQAAKNNIPLNIKTDYYFGKDFSTVNKSMPNGSVLKTATTPSLKKGLIALNDWADYIARRAGMTFNITQKDGIPEIKNPRNKERLIAYLRDEYKVESVALIYMVNNYFKSDISLQVNTMNTDDVEFAVVSYKYPAEIAHNILHLYGAADLFKTLYRRNESKIKKLSGLLPDDVMQDTYGKELSGLQISEYTKYLIGWQETIDSKWEPFFTDNFANF